MRGPGPVPPPLPVTTAREVAPLPSGRGPLSGALLSALRTGSPLPSPVANPDPYGEDLQLALYLCYELHYRTLEGVDPEREWDPDVLAFRRLLERPFLAALRAEVPSSDDVDAALEPLLTEPVDGSGTSWSLQRGGNLGQLREYLAHRSLYHLKEGDPQAWVVGRLQGAAKAAVVTVLHDEYGAGRAERMHARLFADAMREAGLDARYGAYLDHAPAVTLAPVNLMSLTGLHRSLRGAALGQFVLVEVTSSPGSARLAAACERLGAPAAQRFYDEHVEADAVHEQLLRADLLRDLLAREPELAADVVLGLRAGTLLDNRFGEHVVAAWEAGRTSLCRPLPG